MNETAMTAADAFGWQMGLLVAMLSAFGIMLRLLWRFFTQMLDSYRDQITQIFAKYETMLRDVTKVVENNNALLSSLSSKTINVSQ